MLTDSPKRRDAVTKRLRSVWASSRVWAARAQSSANSSSRITVAVVFVADCRRRKSNRFRSVRKVSGIPMSQIPTGSSTSKTEEQCVREGTKTSTSPAIPYKNNNKMHWTYPLSIILPTLVLSYSLYDRCLKKLCSALSCQHTNTETQDEWMITLPTPPAASYWRREGIYSERTQLLVNCNILSTRTTFVYQ